MGRKFQPHLSSRRRASLQIFCKSAIYSPEWAVRCDDEKQHILCFHSPVIRGQVGAITQAANCQWSQQEFSSCGKWDGNLRENSHSLESTRLLFICYTTIKFINNSIIYWTSRDSFYMFLAWKQHMKHEWGNMKYLWKQADFSRTKSTFVASHRLLSYTLEKP